MNRLKLKVYLLMAFASSRSSASGLFLDKDKLIHSPKLTDEILLIKYFISWLIVQIAFQVSVFVINAFIVIWYHKYYQCSLAVVLDSVSDQFTTVSSMQRSGKSLKALSWRNITKWNMVLWDISVTCVSIFLPLHCYMGI